MTPQNAFRSLIRFVDAVWPLVFISFCISIAIGIARGEKMVFGMALVIWPIIGFLSAPLRAVLIFNSRFGTIYRATFLLHIVIATAVSTVIQRGSVIRDSTEEIVGSGWILFVIMHFILFVIAIPTAVLPQFRAKRNTEASIDDAAFPVDSHIKEIADKFSNFQSQMLDEKASFEASLMRFRVLMEKVQADAKSTRHEVEHLRQEAATYKAIAKLSKEEQHDFLRSLDRRKYLEYIVGFTLGVTSSLLASALWLFGQRFLNAT